MFGEIYKLLTSLFLIISHKPGFVIIEFWRINVSSSYLPKLFELKLVD
jgi:hypothetical protein